VDFNAGECQKLWSHMTVLGNDQGALYRSPECVARTEGHGGCSLTDCGKPYRPLGAYRSLGRQCVPDTTSPFDPGYSRLEQLEQNLATGICGAHRSADDLQHAATLATPQRLGIIGALRLQALEIFQRHIAGDVLP
jgi:hypothetical protein